MNKSNMENIIKGIRDVYKRQVVTLAIAARTEKDFIDRPIPPCGACRQVILETEKRYKQPIRILLYGKECIYEVKSIGDLLPLSCLLYTSTGNKAYFRIVPAS